MVAGAEHKTVQVILHTLRAAGVIHIQLEMFRVVIIAGVNPGWMRSKRLMNHGLDAMGGVIAGEGIVVIGPGPIGLMGVGVAKALGAAPVILTGTRDRRLEMGKQLGADEVINIGREDPVDAVQQLTGGKGVQYVLECSGAPNALNEAARMVNRGGRICLAAFPAEPVPVDLAYLVRNNIYVFGIRGEGKSATHRAAALMAQKRFDAKLIHTHTFPLGEVPAAIRYARERIDDAIKVVVQIRQN